jgi:hypothetical protein
MSTALNPCTRCNGCGSEPRSAPDPLAEVYAWLVSEFGFPFDFVTITKPPWLDIDALAHAWSRLDGESPEIYAETIRAETGWAE